MLKKWLLLTAKWWISLLHIARKSWQKWLLMVTLFFSIFTFSGYSSNSQLKQKLVTQSELLLSNNQKTGKRTISYKRAFELIRFDSRLNSQYTSWTNALMTYNLLTKIKLNTISRQFYLYKFPPPLSTSKNNSPKLRREHFWTLYRVVLILYANLIGSILYFP